MSIESEMIAKVDFDAVFAAFKVTVGPGNEKVKEEHVRTYLEMWAKAKSHLYSLFGEKLFLYKDSDFSVDESSMHGMVCELIDKFPKYVGIFQDISDEEFCSNTVTYCNRLCGIYPDIFKKKAKLSKAISKVADDAELDIEISKILQNKSIKGRAILSIHPLDYILMSTSMHDGWGTCMSIVNGFNRSGGFSLMLDPYTVMAYQCGAGVVKYSYKDVSFSWNNKRSRQIIVASPKYDSFVLGHYYGSVDDGSKKIWIDEMTNALSMKPGKNIGRGYCKKMGNFYYDTTYYERYGESKEFNLGVKEIPCAICGEMLTDLQPYEGYIAHKGCAKK